MTLALRRPELLRALVVVDIAPSVYPVSGGRTDDPDEEASPFAAYIEAMRALDLDTLERPPGRRRGAALRRPEPDGAQLPAAEPGPGGVGHDGGWRWRLNLELLERDLERAARLPGAARRARASTARCSGSRARTRPTCCPRTGRAWRRCSRPRGWCG